MTPPTTPAAAEERLRACLTDWAEEGMAGVDSDAALRHFRRSVHHRRPARWVATAAASTVLALAAGIIAGATGGRAPVDVAEAGTLESPAPLPPALVQMRIGTSGSLGEAAHPAAGFLWYVADEGTIDRIDPGTGEVTRVEPGVVASGPFVEAEGRVWFGGRKGEEQRFYGLDPHTARVVVSTDPMSSAGSLATGPAGLWAVTGPRELTQLDGRSGRVLQQVDTGQSVYDVHVGLDVVYAGAGDGGNGITVVDAATGQSRRVLPDLAPGPLALEPDGDLWVQDLRGPALVRLDGSDLTQEVVIPLPGGTSRGAQREHQEGWGDHVLAYPAVEGDSLYVVLNPHGRRLLLRADARTGVVTHVFQTGRGNFAGPATVTDGSVWIASRHVEPLVRRIAAFD